MLSIRRIFIIKSTFTITRSAAQSRAHNNAPIWQFSCWKLSLTIMHNAWLYGQFYSTVKMKGSGGAPKNQRASKQNVNPSFRPCSKWTFIRINEQQLGWSSPDFVRPVGNLWEQQRLRPDTFLLQMLCWVLIKVARRHTEVEGQRRTMPWSCIFPSQWSPNSHIGKPARIPVPYWAD